MIKKALAFVLLMGTGFLILYAETGGESLAGLGGPGHVGQTETNEEEGTGILVPLEKEQEAGDGLMVSYTGPGKLTESTEVVLPDGSVRRLELYRLHFTDSRPRRDLGGIYELEGVRVEFFETKGPPEQPVAVKAGELTARLAYVELGMDEEGNRSVAMDRDLDLREAVLVTGEEARVKNIELTIERALVRSTDEKLFVRTATDEQPFALEILAADGPATLTGRGLNAEFPMSENKSVTTGEAAAITVSHDAVFVHRGKAGESRLTADGPLSYVEDPTTGVAVISAVGHVRVQGAGAQLTKTADSETTQPLVATGDRLRATLLRSKTKDASGKPQIAWRTMHLMGSDTEPAGIHGRGLDLKCAAVDVTPNLEGEPWLFTARGKPVLDYEVDGRTMKFEAAERIHLARLSPYFAPWLRNRGWSSWSVSPHVGELFIFEGRSSLVLPHKETTLTLKARDGLRVLRGIEETELITVRGLGPIELETAGKGDPLSVTGNNGFRLHVDERGQTLRLGPAEIDPNHQFTLQTAELQAKGSGSFRLFRPTAADQPGDIRLQSPRSNIELTIPGTDGSLRQVATLTAGFDAGAVRSFDARGEKCRLVWRGKEGAIDGTAVRIHSTSPNTWILEGAPAVVKHDKGTFEGRQIKIVRLSQEDTVLEATGDARLKIDEIPGAKKGAPATRLDLSAERIVYLPFIAPRTAIQVGGWPALPRSLWAIPSSAHRAHLVARRGVVVEHLDPDDKPISHAEGDDLVLELGDVPTGRLTGAPAVVTRRDETGQDVRAAAPVILLAGDGQSLSLRPQGDQRARITIGNRQGPLASFGRAGGSTRVVCDGPVDVEKDAIWFRGPVEVTSLGPEGEIEPDGFQVKSGRMHMGRSADTGEIVSVHTTHGSDLRWRGIEIQARQVSLDLVRHLGTVVDNESGASVQLPNGSRGRFSRVEFNYLTYESTAWHSQLKGDQTDR